MNNRTFQISGGSFGGFETQVNLDLVEKNEDIIQYVINQLRQRLGNMFTLNEKLDEESSQYHIHGIEFGTILISEPNVIFYVCNHCENQ